MDVNKIRENPYLRNSEYIEPGELERRLQAVQSMMAAQELDVILVDRAFADKWLTNSINRGFTGGLAIIPRQGRVLCTLGYSPAPDGRGRDMSECAVFGEDGTFITWEFGHGGIFDRYMKLHAGHAFRHPTCDIVDSIGSLDICARAASTDRIGTVRFENMPAVTVDSIRSSFPSTQFVDVTQEFSQIIASKSENDLELVAQLADQHDRLCEQFGSLLVPGVDERSLVVDLKYRAYRLGAAGDNWRDNIPVLVNSFPMDSAWSTEPLNYPGRTILPGDCVTMRVQSNGISGYYGAIGRCWTLGAPSEFVKARWEDCVQAVDYCASLLKPGVTLDTVKHELQSWLSGRGFRTWLGCCVHGVGFSAVEAPTIDGASAAMPLAENMVLSVRVPLWKEGEAPSPFACEDMYVITASGARRLTQFPRNLNVRG